MNRNSASALLTAASLVSAFALAAPSFASGARPTQIDPIAQAATGAADAGMSGAGASSGRASAEASSGSPPATTPSGATPPATTPSGATPSGTGAAGAASTPSVPTADAVFDLLDTDEDGVLSREEFARATIRSQ